MMRITILVALLNHPSKEAECVCVTKRNGSATYQMSIKNHSLSLLSINTRILQLFPLSLGSKVRVQLGEIFLRIGQFAANGVESVG
jgi:hypothetical protein